MELTGIEYGIQGHNKESSTHSQCQNDKFFAPLWLAHYAVLVYLGNGAINSGAGAILRQLFNFNQNLAAAGPRLACQWTFTKCWKIIKCENMLYMYHHHQILVYFPSEKWGSASNKQFIWRVVNIGFRLKICDIDIELQAICYVSRCLGSI